jgi:hypothetical protein
VIGPRLAKARSAPLVAVRNLLVVRRSNARWRELFERADVMSEGSAREEAEGRIWYGSTSLILPVAEAEKGDGILFARMAERDVHLRLRALRMAHREAAVRAPCGLGRVVCEIRVIDDERGVRIDVDVQAPLIDEGTIARRAR